MLEALKKLVSVKSIVTILLTLVFCYLSVVGRISGEQFLTIFVVVIGFYFGTQYEKKRAKAAAQQEEELQ